MKNLPIDHATFEFSDDPNNPRLSGPIGGMVNFQMFPYDFDIPLSPMSERWGLTFGSSDEDPSLSSDSNFSSQDFTVATYSNSTHPSDPFDTNLWTQDHLSPFLFPPASTPPALDSPTPSPELSPPTFSPPTFSPPTTLATTSPTSTPPSPVFKQLYEEEITLLHLNFNKPRVPSIQTLCQAAIQGSEIRTVKVDEDVCRDIKALQIQEIVKIIRGHYKVVGREDADEVKLQSVRTALSRGKEKGIFENFGASGTRPGYWVVTYRPGGIVPKDLNEEARSLYTLTKPKMPFIRQEVRWVPFTPVGSARKAGNKIKRGRGIEGRTSEFASSQIHHEIFLPKAQASSPNVGLVSGSNTPVFPLSLIKMAPSPGPDTSSLTMDIQPEDISRLLLDLKTEGLFPGTSDSSPGASNPAVFDQFFNEFDDFKPPLPPQFIPVSP